MTAFDQAWALLKELRLEQTFDIDDDGVPIFDLRLLHAETDEAGEYIDWTTEDVTDRYDWNELDQQDMDQLDPVIRLYNKLVREARRKGFGSDHSYDPYSLVNTGSWWGEYGSDINSFIDKLKFWSGEVAYDTPFGPHSMEGSSMVPAAKDMLRRWREGEHDHARTYGGA